MKTLTIEFNQDGIQARIEVRRCSGLDGIRRGQMIEEAHLVEDTDITLHIARIAIVPLLLSATDQAIIMVDETTLPWPISAESLQHVPESLLDDWMSAIYDLNPKLDELYARLANALSDDGVSGLPEIIDLNDFEFSWRVYLLLEMFNWEFLPSQILAEDEALLDDLIAIRSSADLMRRQKQDADDGRVL